MQEIWDVHVSDWIRDKVIVRPNSRPWLCHLEYYPQDERGWDEPVFSFSQCLGFVMQPFYCLRDALHTIRRCMTEELWKTSIFSPLPITPDHRKQWHEHSERFSLRHFVRTEQRKRKLAFEDFVGQEKARGHSIREIAEEARDRHLWPYGTPRRSRTKDYDPQAACERAVSRMIATLRVRDRLKVQLREQGARHDLVDAVFSLSGQDDLLMIVRRVEALGKFLDSDDGKNLLAGYKRATNIIRIEEKKDKRDYTGAPDSKRYQLPEEKALAEAIDIAKKEASGAVAKKDFAAAMRALAKLRPYVDVFFDKVTVNVNDIALRENRLKLLNEIREATRAVADFSKIEG
jgi:hypothetical protein